MAACQLCMRLPRAGAHAARHLQTLSAVWPSGWAHSMCPGCWLRSSTASRASVSLAGVKGGRTAEEKLMLLACSKVALVGKRS